MEQKRKRGHNWRQWPSSRQTHVKIAPELHRRLKVRAAQDGLTLQELVETLLSRALLAHPVRHP